MRISRYFAKSHLIHRDIEPANIFVYARLQ
jgi:serine/threonine protein kinase